MASRRRSPQQHRTITPAHIRVRVEQTGSGWVVTFGAGEPRSFSSAAEAHSYVRSALTMSSEPGANDTITVVLVGPDGVVRDEIANAGEPSGASAWLGLRMGLPVGPSGY